MVPQTLLNSIQARLDALERDHDKPLDHQPRISSPQQTGLENEGLPAFPNSVAARHLSDMGQMGPNLESGQAMGASAQLSSNNVGMCAMMHIPGKAEADFLIENYKNLAYPTFQVLNMAEFEAEYSRLIAPPLTPLANSPWPNNVFLATVEMVFALGCVTNVNKHQKYRPADADAFYQRARALAPLDACDEPNTDYIRYLLLVVHYLSFTTYSHRAHHAIAVAIKIAQGLELDTNTYHASQDQLQGENARRLWHLCLLFER